MKRLVVFSAVVVLSLSAIPLSRAQSDAMKGMDMKDMDMNKCKDMMGKEKGMDMKDMDMNKCMDMMGKDKKSAGKKSDAKSHKGIGTVKKVDRAAGTVTLAHGPVESMKWPAMTMSFAIRDKAMLDKLSPEKKVEFEFVQRGTDYVITSVK